MTWLSVKLAKAVIRGSGLLGFPGLGGSFGAARPPSADPRVRFAEAFYEIDHIGEFYRIFPQLPDGLAGAEVLDFGCGYGGKTCEYAAEARTVCGIEPFQRPIDLARAFADHRAVNNVRFDVCTQDSVPYPDNSFDIILCHDVLEHVADPSVSLNEMLRVLRPGGQAFIAFPPYDGMLSHHLDYASQLPGIHWLFGPDALVKAINEMIEEGRLAIKVQPEPELDWTGTRKVLPCLNGLTTEQFTALAHARFDYAQITRRMAGAHRRGMVASIARGVFRAFSRSMPKSRDRFTGGIVAILTKHQSCLSANESETNAAACVAESSKSVPALLAK